MRVVLITGMMCAALAAFEGLPQGKGPLHPPTPPTDAELLPPVQDPPPTRIERDDLLQRFVPKTLLTGIWRLRAIGIGGRELTDEARGYLAIGRTHLSLQIVQEGDGEPLVQSGFRDYRIEDDELVTTALVGFDNHEDGKLRFEAPGFVERRRFQVSGATLRVTQGNDRYMEFERIE